MCGTACGATLMGHSGGGSRVQTPGPSARIPSQIQSGSGCSFTFWSPVICLHLWNSCSLCFSSPVCKIESIIWVCLPFGKNCCKDEMSWFLEISNYRAQRTENTAPPMYLSSLLGRLKKCQSWTSNTSVTNALKGNHHSIRCLCFSFNVEWKDFRKYC